MSVCHEFIGEAGRTLRVLVAGILVFQLTCALACAKIQADGTRRSHGLEIIGTSSFIDRVAQALLLLKDRDARDYAIVTEYIGRIEEGSHSGMWAYQIPPAFEMSKDEAFYSVTWCAGVIAHDSFHSKLFHEYRKSHFGPDVPDEAWTGTEAERECMSHQIAVMACIAAPKWEVDYAIKQSDGKYVPDHQSWSDYQRTRKW